jgi:hypothetical protein
MYDRQLACRTPGNYDKQRDRLAACRTFSKEIAGKI